MKRRKLKKRVERLERQNRWLTERVESLSRALNKMSGEIRVGGVVHLVECDVVTFGKKYACTCGSEPLGQNTPATQVENKPS
jgi:hypothetical protein